MKPFPLLSLPAELRLQIYDYHLPSSPYLSIWDKPTRAYTPPRLDLSILRANHQLHYEISEHFYKDRLLYMQVCRGFGYDGLRPDVLSRCYETVANMPEKARASFKKLEVMVGNITNGKEDKRRYPDIDQVQEPLKAMLALLPNLENLLVSFSRVSTSPPAH